jgi:hypothetical protein
MKHILSSAILAASVVAGPPATAQESDGIAAEMDIAQCVVENDSRDVKRLLGTLPGSAEERRAERPLVELFGACKDNSIVKGTFAWRERAVIAAAAAAARAGRGNVSLVAAAQQSGWALASSAVPGEGNGAVSLALRRFGDCIVRAEPDAARDLIVSAPQSSAEESAIAALTPALGPCLAAGQQLRIDRGDLRLVVGEPIYHLLAR